MLRVRAIATSVRHSRLSARGTAALSTRSNHDSGAGHKHVAHPHSTHKHAHAPAASAPSGSAPTNGRAPSNLPPERDSGADSASSGWLPLSQPASRWTSAAASLLASMGSVAPELQAKVQLRAAGLLRQSLLSNLPLPPPELAERRAQPRPPAKVRIGRDAQGRRVLCDEELAMMATRRAKARTHLARYFEGAFPVSRPTVRDPPDPAAAADESLPSIGMALSGGGHRAMLSGLGSLTAMQHQGLWDSALYIAGLSGGTWAMSQIYANPHHHALRMAEIDRMVNEEIAQRSTADASASGKTTPLFNPLLHSPVDLKRVSEDLMSKVAHKNLFEDVPLEFIQSCIVDKFALYAEQQAHSHTHSHPHAVTKTGSHGAHKVPHSKPIVATSPSVTAAPVTPAVTAAPAPSASAVALPAPASLADRLTLSSFANVLSSIGLGDAFGWSLAHKLLAPPPAAAAAASPTASAATPASSPALRVAQLHPRLSDQISLLQRVSLPYPLWAAITRRGEQLEFTPHEVGMPCEADVYVPSYAFGARFDKGVECEPESTSELPKQPELSFGLLLACFASAFPTRIGRILEELIYTSRDSRSEPLLRFMHSILHDRRVNLGQESAFEPTHTNNFMRRLDQSEDARVAEHARKHVSKSLLDASQISVMDAGLSFNVPWPPLLHPARTLDVIIAFDASSPPEVLAADALRIGSEYAARFGLPFPNLRRGVQLPTGMGSEAEQQRALDAVLAGVRFSDAPPVDEEEPLTPVLVRASHSVVSLFPGDVARGIPSIIYLPLIANTAYETSEEYRRNSGGAGAAAAKAKQIAGNEGWASRLYASATSAGASAPKAVPSAIAVAPASTPASSLSPSSFKAGAPSASPRSSSSPSCAALPILSSSSASVANHFDPRANFLSGGFCATLTFQLAPWQSEAIMGLSYTNAMQAAPAIKAVLKAIRGEKARQLALQQKETN